MSAIPNRKIILLLLQSNLALFFLYNVIILVSRMSCGTLPYLQHLNKMSYRRGYNEDLHWRSKSVNMLSLPGAFQESISVIALLSNLFTIQILHCWQTYNVSPLWAAVWILALVFNQNLLAHLLEIFWNTFLASHGLFKLVQLW